MKKLSQYRKIMLILLFSLPSLIYAQSTKPYYVELGLNQFSSLSNNQSSAVEMVQNPNYPSAVQHMKNKNKPKYQLGLNIGVGARFLLDKAWSWSVGSELTNDNISESDNGTLSGAPSSFNYKITGNRIGTGIKVAYSTGNITQNLQAIGVGLRAPSGTGQARGRRTT